MKLYFLSSRRRISGTASNFVLDLRETLSIADGCKFRIDQLRLGIAFMLVNENNRNIFFRVGNYVGRAVLEIGQYSSEQLATTLQFCINLALPKNLGGVQVSYNSVSAHTTLTFTSSQNLQFQLLALADVARLPAASWPEVSLADPKLFNDVLGTYTSDGRTLVFRFVSCQPFDVIYLCSSKLGGSSYIHGPRFSSDTLMKIVVRGSFGEVQEAEMPYNVWVGCKGLSTNELDFQLKDHDGHLIDMSLGGDVSFLLTIDEGS
jgi:hypothetical protein